MVAAELPLVDDGFVATRAALKWWATRQAPPTSSLTGGGAIAELECLLGKRFGGYALALPSGSSAIRTGLRALDVGRGSTVRLPLDDWFGGAGLIRSVGAVVVGNRSPKSVDLVIAGGHDAEPSRLGVSVLVDAAEVAPPQFARWRLAGWDALVLSFGPGKPIDAGEGGVLVLRDQQRYGRALRLTQHPIRQRLNGVDVVNLDGPFERMHPVTAVIALHKLATSV